VLVGAAYGHAARQSRRGPAVCDREDLTLGEQAGPLCTAWERDDAQTQQPGLGPDRDKFALASVSAPGLPGLLALAPRRM
jgi:hypothetical protein